MDPSKYSGEGYGSSDLHQAFSAARANYQAMVTSLDFADLCEANGIRPYGSPDCNPWVFWEFVALRSYMQYGASLEAGEDPRLAVLTHLTLLTPKMMLDQTLLENQTGRKKSLDQSDPVYEDAVNSMDYYQRLIRATVAAYPDLKPSELDAHLKTAAAEVVQTAHLPAGSAERIQRRLRGVKCEVWATEALRAAGCHVKQAGRRGNVRMSTDFYFITADGRPLRVDVKASRGAMHAIRKTDCIIRPNYIANRAHQVIVIQPFDSRRLKDTDSFHLSPDDALADGQWLRDQLEEAALLLNGPLPTPN